MNRKGSTRQHIHKGVLASECFDELVCRAIIVDGVDLELRRIGSLRRLASKDRKVERGFRAQCVKNMRAKETTGLSVSFVSNSY